MNDSFVPAVISILRNNPSLESVNLKYNFFSDKSIDALKNVATENPNLNIEL